MLTFRSTNLYVVANHLVADLLQGFLLFISSQVISAVSFIQVLLLRVFPLFSLHFSVVCVFGLFVCSHHVLNQHLWFNISDCLHLSFIFDLLISFLEIFYALSKSCFLQKIPFPVKSWLASLEILFHFVTSQLSR